MVQAAIFDNSPVAHLKLVVSGAGLITSIILGWTIILWLKDPLYGIGVGNTNSIIFLGVVYGAAALLYVGARLVRREPGHRPRRHPLGDPGRIDAALTGPAATTKAGGRTHRPSRSGFVVARPWMRSTAGAWGRAPAVVREIATRWP